MGLFDWIRRLIDRSPEPDTVPFYDLEAGALVRMPRWKLDPKAVQAQVEGIDGVVWVLPAQLKQGPIRHEPFDEGIRARLRHIQTALSEHFPQTLEQWEDGFQRDASPEREIEVWERAAEVYLEFASGEDSPDRRREVYECISACMTAGPDSIGRTYIPRHLDQPEAQRIVDRYFGADR